MGVEYSGAAVKPMLPQTTPPGPRPALRADELRRLIIGRAAAFSVGVPGVIAEFHWAHGDRVVHDDGGTAVATARGALAVALEGDEGLVTVPGDAGSRAGERVLWLPAEAARIAPEPGLAELGPDTAAVQPCHRGELLFDLGFGLGHLRACVRTANASLLRVLRTHAGEDLLAPGSAALAALRSSSPHRVFLSARARIEVYQPIPSRGRGERTPDGPHTHVLPALLRAADPIQAALPAGARAVLSIHPGSA
jgi:hypothetical protein